jgi:predicted transcriptional regulator
MSGRGGKTGQNLERYTFRVDDALGSALTNYCHQEDIKPSQVMRKALRQFIPPSYFKGRRLKPNQSTISA